MSPLSRDLTSPRLIIAKGLLFLLTGALASAILTLDILADTPALRTLLMHALAIWCFARAYYFAFYVIQNYIDPTYKFAGLLSTARWLLHHHRPAR